MAKSLYQREETLERIGKVRECVREILDNGDCFTLKTLAVSGKDLMELGVPKGPKIGECLNAALEEVMKDPAKNYKRIPDRVRKNTAVEPKRQTREPGTEQSVPGSLLFFAGFMRSDHAADPHTSRTHGQCGTVRSPWRRCATALYSCAATVRDLPASAKQSSFSGRVPSERREARRNGSRRFSTFRPSAASRYA